MSDLIDRDKVIKTICECNCYSGDDPCEEGKSCYEVREVRAIPTIDIDEVIKSRKRLYEIDKLKDQIKKLEQACDNYDKANIVISNELTETRWKLIKAQERIKELERLDIDWEVARND